MTSGDAFDELEAVLSEGTYPFPITHVRRLVLKATSGVEPTAAIAAAIDDLHNSLAFLSVMIEMNHADEPSLRREAMTYLALLRTECATARQRLN